RSSGPMACRPTTGWPGSSSRRAPAPAPWAATPDAPSRLTTPSSSRSGVAGRKAAKRSFAALRPRGPLGDEEGGEPAPRGCDGGGHLLRRSPSPAPSVFLETPAPGRRVIGCMDGTELARLIDRHAAALVLYA